MPRRLRKDHPGAWHHVMSRGIARRTIFETRRDVRYFLSCLARQVRKGDLEVHAYAVLTTHFHLLVRSPTGRLSAAMQRALDAYARWFNRSRRRDGPLFRGRFVNRLVETEGYWWTVLRYIDRNPVEARLAARAFEYPHGSAWHFARPRGPRWLERRVVEKELRGGREGPWDPAEYVRWATLEDPPGSPWVVERRLADGTPRREDPLDELLRAAPGAVRRWMDRKAADADGTTPGWPVVSPRTLGAQVERRRRRVPGRSLDLGRRKVPFWEVLEAGLLRLGSGLRHEEIAGRMGLALSTAQRRLGDFARGAAARPELLAEATAVLEEALRNDHGAAVPGGGPGRRGVTLLRLAGGATTALTDGIAH